MAHGERDSYFGPLALVVALPAVLSQLETKMKIDDRNDALKASTALKSASVERVQTHCLRRIWTELSRGVPCCSSNGPSSKYWTNWEYGASFCSNRSAAR